MTVRWPAVLSIGLFVLAPAFAQEEASEPLSRLTLTRNDRTIEVRQFAPSSEGGEFRLFAKGCEEEVRLSTIYGPVPYLIETLVNDTRILSNIVLDRRPLEDEGGQEAATLELFGGRLQVSQETLCPEEVERSPEPDVTIFEGRTVVSGTTFNYDNATGLGNLSGPVTLERSAEGNSPALSATSGSMLFNVDEDITTLKDNVRVESETRVSEAETLEYDDATGLAVLRGSPARSREGEDVVEGSVIEYDLDLNDVVVRGEVRATFRYDR